MSFESIKIEREKNIAWIILNRPHKLNVFNDVLLDELSEVLDIVDNDPSIRSIIITGEGDRAFSAGADITSFLKLTSMKAADYSRKGQKIFSKIEELSKPVIAAINGYALGAGLELALACDFRIASNQAQLGNTEINLGIMPGWGGTQRLVRVIGIPNTKRLVMLGDRIKATEAFKMSLVDKVVPSEKLKEESKALAIRLSNGPPVAMKYAKHAINFGTQVPLDTGMRIEASLWALLFSTEDSKRGVEAFMARKKPEFKGD